jgi:voltage-gated potassium channel
MLCVALWILIQWYLEVQQLLSPRFLYVADWLIWLFFLGETFLLGSLVRDRRGYLTDNWMNVAIIIAGVPIFWNSALSHM